jgi:epoxyqueuosine reductase QueG
VIDLSAAKDAVEAQGGEMAAQLPGLGWIGRSCLLVTPEAGPEVRRFTVLTHSDLGKTGEAMGERCGR